MSSRGEYRDVLRGLAASTGCVAASTGGCRGTDRGCRGDDRGGGWGVAASTGGVAASIGVDGFGIFLKYTKLQININNVCETKIVL